MSGMVERVARAIYAEQFGGVTGISWEASMDDHRDEATVYARAAIEAMREPTEAMLEAGDDIGSVNPIGVDQVVYTAMIDAALKEPA